MKFYYVFFRLLPFRPRFALAALYWRVTGRKVRARNRLRIATAQSPHAYDTWIRTMEPQRPAPVPPHVAPGHPPLISVIAQAPSPAQIAALKQQSFTAWEWAEGVNVARGTWLLPLPDGATLPPDALARYAEATVQHSDADIIYGDHDELSGAGKRQRPWFKPEWNAEMFLAQDYLTQACMIRASLSHEMLPSRPGVYATLLATTAAGARIVHIPHILAHLPQGTTYLGQAAQSDAVGRHIAPMGGTVHPGLFETVRIAWPLDIKKHYPALVSIIIPTRDRVELLRCCLDGVLGRTDYPQIEVIVVDNGSRESAALTYLANIQLDPRVRVLRDDGDFNFSRLNNRAVQIAHGEFLCLLNNDIDIIDDGWLTALMRQATRPDAGAVGAKLLYDDGTIQHAGVVIGMGGAAGHAHRFQKNEAEGYFAQAHIAHYVSAVTAACLVVAKRKFAAVGGLDEDAFAVAFNDVDLCLKLGRAGWKNIYEPAAVLIHHESKSRARDTIPTQMKRYLRELSALQNRWKTEFYQDPLFHPALNATAETYLLNL